jgi:hypothetical protein
MSKRLSATFSVFKGAAAAVTALGASAVALGVRVGDAADELLDLSQMTGLSTDALQEFRRVATIAGVDQDMLAEAAKKMTARFARGAEGSADLRQGLAQLGIASRTASGGVRPMSDVVGEAVEALASMEDVTQRNVLATKLFGRGASELTPILGLGANAIASARAEAHELGLVLDRDALESANQFRQEWQTLRASLSASASEIGITLVPALSLTVTWIQDKVVPAVRDAVEWFDRFRDGVSKLDTTELNVRLLQDLAPEQFEQLPDSLKALAREARATGPALLSVGTQTERFVEHFAPLGRSLLDTVTLFDTASRSIFDYSGRIGEAAALTDAMRLPAEVLAEELARLEGHLISGRISQETYNRAVAAAQAEFRHATEEVNVFGDAVADVTLDGIDAFVDFATGAGDAMGAFVKRALADLAKLTARMLIVRGIMSALPGVGSFLGLGRFAGGFASGGTIPAGQFGVVAEAGRPEVVHRPSFVSGPAQVTPIGGGTPPPFILPPSQDPIEYAHNARFMRAFHEWWTTYEAGGGGPGWSPSRWGPL